MLIEPCLLLTINEWWTWPLHCQQKLPSEIRQSDKVIRERGVAAQIFGDVKQVLYKESYTVLWYSKQKLSNCMRRWARDAAAARISITSLGHCMFNNRKIHRTSGFLVSSFRTASRVIRSCLNKTAVCAAADSLNHPSITTTPVWNKDNQFPSENSDFIYYMNVWAFQVPLQIRKKSTLSDPHRPGVKTKYLKYTLFTNSNTPHDTLK